MKVLAVVLALISHCWAATTVEILAADPNFSTLVSLVTQAGLVDALNSGTFTVFAPTNDAFSALSNETLAALGSDVNALANVLKYHVVQGSIQSSAATNELKLTTLNGQDIRFNIYSHNNVVTIQGSTITEFDKMADNGVIHVLSQVMMPPSGDIVDYVAATPELSTLLSLVQQAGIASALKGDPFTLFAPTNAAFAKLSPDTIQTLTNDVNLLTEILEYHVVPHTEYSAGLYNREHLKTIDQHNDIIRIHIDGNGVRLNSNSMVIKADIGTTNGVIHLIDTVLIPNRYQHSIVVGRK